MTKSEFISLLNDPTSISEERVNSLLELTKSFPYCQSAYILLAKASSDNDSMHANQMLKKAASYASNRQILKQIIRKKKSVITSAPLVKKEKNSETVKEQKKESKIVEVKKTEIIKDSPAKGIIEELQQTLAKSKELKKEIEKTDISIKETPTSKSKETEKKKVEKELPKNKVIDIKEEKESKSPPLGYQIYSSRLGNTIEMEGDFTTEYPFSLSEENYTISAPILKSKNDIVDEFIEKSPSIKRSKKTVEVHKIENLADKSIRRKKSPATETLAKLYASQGNKKKAQKIYEDLILKNPEKRSYFAALIEQL